MFGRKKPLFVSADQKYRKLKKKFYILLAIFILFVFGTSYYIYLSYDYLAFKHLISQNYVYKDALDEMYKKELNRDVDGKYFKYFDNVVLSIVTRELREYKNDRYTFQYLPEQYKASKKDTKKEADQSYVKELSNDIIYLKLTNYSKYTKNFMKKEIKTLKKYPNIIIDLRDNPGGDVSALYYMNDLFLPKGDIMAFDITRSNLFTRTVKSKKGQTLEYDHIIILQNKNSASSSEGFISALNDNLSNVTLMGETTFGKGIGQFTLPLKDGFAIKATTMLWNTPKNINIQGVGIPAEVEYTGDDIIDYAVKYINEK